MKHQREAATPMKDGEPTARLDADEIVADCSCGGTYSVPAGGVEYRALEEAHAQHIKDTREAK